MNAGDDEILREAGRTKMAGEEMEQDQSLAASEVRKLADQVLGVEDELRSFRLKTPMSADQEEEIRNLEGDLRVASQELSTKATAITLGELQPHIDQIKGAIGQAQFAIATINNIKKAIMVSVAVIKLAGDIAGQQWASVPGDVMELLGAVQAVLSEDR